MFNVWSQLTWNQFFFSFVAQPLHTGSHRSCCKAPPLAGQLVRRNRITPQAFRMMMGGKTKNGKEGKDNNNNAMPSGSIWLEAHALGDVSLPATPTITAPGLCGMGPLLADSIFLRQQRSG